MAHPRMYDDGDPHLAEVRRICLALPEVVEVEAWGRPTFRAGKMFAVFSGSPEYFTGNPDRAWGLIFRPTEEERPALVADARFYSPPSFGPLGWLALDLGAAEV